MAPDSSNAHLTQTFGATNGSSSDNVSIAEGKGLTPPKDAPYYPPAYTEDDLYAMGDHPNFPTFT